MGMIFWLSSRSSLPSPPGISYAISANAGHFLVFFALATFILFGLGAGKQASRRELYIAGALALLYGVSDELHQSFVPGRDASVLDLAADAAGIVVALAWVVTWRRIATS
jgi:VanZ family protein